ncbi:MAG: 4-hydroxythreonine-4-phosphate dehydrogenase PdxA [Alphaproteobacteria bacterium]|nr:4-hydroxythreonine-4-phosphate dehydrogenase PdxA [Alphaproteobacteria bacterium]
MPAERDTAALPKIAVPIGDPSGIGPEIAVMAARDPQVTTCCRPLLVGDRAVVERAARSCSLRAADLSVEDVAALKALPEPGTLSAAAGAATIAYATAAIALARMGAVEAVVACPHNETAIAQAGIEFDGYPGLLARETGHDPGAVFLMLVSPTHRIVHVTLHMGLRAALDAITESRILAAARAADGALKSIGIARPRLAVCGINPHAGEGGLFGDEDETIVRPAVAAARAEGIEINGPFGADVALAAAEHDAYLAMYHDQGHIPAKLAGRGNTFGVSIGAGVLFSTVAHGSAHDIAGQCRADPAGLIRAITHMGRLLRRAGTSATSSSANSSNPCKPLTTSSA